MKKFFANNTDIGTLILRLGVGITFILVHGLPKIVGGPQLWAKVGSTMTKAGIPFAPEFWGFMASASEFVGGILLIIGLYTRPAAAFMAFTMFVATAHHLSAHDPWGTVANPLRMMVVFIALIFWGAGKYSIDGLIASRKKMKA